MNIITNDLILVNFLKTVQFSKLNLFFISTSISQSDNSAKQCDLSDVILELFCA